jgi:hypothetical protein
VLVAVVHALLVLVHLAKPNLVLMTVVLTRRCSLPAPTPVAGIDRPRVTEPTNLYKVRKSYVGADT